MNRLFRKSRMAQLNSNRIGKYILYALGEIILVIAGILIALQINNRNELKKNEIKINALLEDVQRDLLSDLDDLEVVMAVYERKDSLIDLALIDSLKQADYLMNPELFSLLTTYIAFESKDNAYKNLMRNSDILPDHYSELVPLLDDLYLENNGNIISVQNHLKELVNQTIADWSTQHTWYLDLRMNQFNSEALEYLMNDPYYKNSLATFKIYASDNLLRFYRGHQLQSVRAYHSIHRVLGSNDRLPEVISNYLVELSEEKKDELIGQYDIAPTFGIRIFKDEDDLLAQATGQQPFALFAKSDSVLFNPMYDIQLRFESNAQGQYGFTLIQLGRENFFTKQENAIDQ